MSPLRANDDAGHVAIHIVIVQTVFGSVHEYFFRFSCIAGTDAPYYRVAVFVAGCENFVFSPCCKSIDMTIIRGQSVELAVGPKGSPVSSDIAAEI